MQVTAWSPPVHVPLVALLSAIIRVLAQGPEKASLSLGPTALLFSPPATFLHPYSLLSDLALLHCLPLTCPVCSSLRVIHPAWIHLLPASLQT